MISKLTLIVISILIFGLVVTSVVQAATTITASVDYVNYTEKDEMYIDTGMNVSGDIIYESAKIYIENGYVKGEDYLNFTDSNGITGYFNESNGVLTLSGYRDAVAYQAAFRHVKYINTNHKPHPGSREILYVLGNTTLYFQGTHHYYECVYTPSSISWNEAKSAAENRSYDGLQGYLATISSSEENEYIGPKVSENTWIGASDKVSEGQWKWVTGPEAGILFYSGNYPGTEIGYNNWITGKPNGYLDGKDFGEDYAHICGKSCGKKWNDCPDENYISSYLVEYGGMSGETLPQLMVTVSINVIPVNDIPTTPGEFSSPAEGQIIKGNSSIKINWGASTDADGDTIGYDLWFFNGSWTQIGELLSNNSMLFTLPQDNTDSAMFRVYASDTKNNSSARDVIFAIDSAGPAYTWINKVPNGTTGENITVIVNLNDISDINVHNITIDGQEYEMMEDSGNYFWNISIPGSDSGNTVSSIIYNCTFGDVLGNTNSTGEIPINVSILPYADFDANLTIGTEPFAVTFTDASYYADSWYWDFGDGSTSEDKNPTHVFNSGTFTANLTAININGSSSKTIKIDVLKKPELTVEPNETEKISLYGDEINFSISSNLLSNFEWFIDGKQLNSTGIRYCRDNSSSGFFSCCKINSSQYINQTDFFVETYNISVLVSNESTRRTDTFTWEWIVTDSSAENSEDICFVVVKEANLTKIKNQTIAEFNTTENSRTDDNNITGSLTGVSFDAPDYATGLLLKFEVISKYSINTSGTNFSVASVYQHMDISVNNKTLVNESSNRFIEFRVLNRLNGDVLNVTSIQLQHRDSFGWETYTVEHLRDDEKYSYYLVNNVSGFSPFTITATYDHPSETKTIDEGMPAYLKKEWLQAKNKESAQPYEESSKGLDAPTIKGELVSGEQNNLDFESDMDDPDQSDIGKMVLTAVAMIITILLSIMVLMNKIKE